MIQSIKINDAIDLGLILSDNLYKQSNATTSKWSVRHIENMSRDIKKVVMRVRNTSWCKDVLIGKQEEMQDEGKGME